MDNRKIELYNIKRDNGDQFILRAYISSGCLYLEGQDFSSLAEELYGDEEYEYYYSFTKEDTDKLLSILGGDDILNAVDSFFDKEMKNTDFKQLCQENGIEIKTHVI